MRWCIISVARYKWFSSCAARVLKTIGLKGMRARRSICSRALVSMLVVYEVLLMLVVVLVYIFSCEISKGLWGW